MAFTRTYRGTGIKYLDPSRASARDLLLWAPLDGPNANELFTRGGKTFRRIVPNGAEVWAGSERGYSWFSDGSTTNDARLEAIEGFSAVPPFTLSCWAYYTGAKTGHIALVCASIGSNNNRTSVLVTSGGNWAGETRRTAANTADSGVTAEVNTWTHLAVSMSQSGANPWQFYLNGQRVVSESGSVPDVVAAFRLGNRSDGSSRGFSGHIRDVRVYGSYFDGDTIPAEYLDEDGCRLPARRYFFVGAAAPEPQLEPVDLQAGTTLAPVSIDIEPEQQLAPETIQIGTTLGPVNAYVDTLVTKALQAGTTLNPVTVSIELEPTLAPTDVQAGTTLGAVSVTVEVEQQLAPETLQAGTTLNPVSLLFEDVGVKNLQAGTTLAPVVVVVEGVSFTAETIRVQPVDRSIDVQPDDRTIKIVQGIRETSLT